MTRTHNSNIIVAVKTNMTTEHLIYTLVSVLALIGLYEVMLVVDRKIDELITKYLDKPQPAPVNGTDSGKYYLLDKCYPTSEARQAAAGAHPVWKIYREWDRKTGCGVPDMNDIGDRIEFEAFVTMLKR